MATHTPSPVRVISPPSFPHDPRYEQTRTPLHTIYPRYRVASKCSKRGESPLLRLPDEILAQITRCLAKIDQGHHLPNFALAHSECRQLARPFQFADVWIIDGELPWQFLRFLLHENRDDGSMPSIGSCVRALTFTLKGDFSRFVHHGPEYQGYDKAEEDWYRYWQGMLGDLAKVIKHKLPMLEHVHWQHVENELHLVETPDDATWVDLMPAVLEKTTCSGRVRTLYLEDDTIPTDESGRTEDWFPGDEPLCITDLAIGRSRFHVRDDARPGPSHLGEMILRRSAQFLESIAFNPAIYMIGWDDNVHQIEFRDGPICFPRLRKFWSFPEYPQSIHPIVATSFLSGPIESFAPSPEFCAVIRRESHPLPHLRTWAVTDDPDDYQSRDPGHLDKCLRAAQAYGDQIEELFIYMLDAQYWEGGKFEGVPMAMPSHLASGRFSNLRSLCFAWEWEPDMSIFKHIAANLRSLEELSFGLLSHDRACPDGYDFYEPEHLPKWGPHCHAEWQSALAPLQNLQRLGIFAEEYVADFAGPRWAWHRYIKDYVWFLQGRSQVSRSNGNMPFTGNPWHESVRGHKNAGKDEDDWLTRKVICEYERVGDGLYHLDDSEMREGACALGGEYAAVLPKLQELMFGRILIQIRN